MLHDADRGTNTASGRNMNPYVQTALVMCGIVFLALAATSYLAVMFNRRAKEDLEAALRPLAERISGDLDLEKATVTGRDGTTLVAARMTNASEGLGRVFQTEIVDAAGGCRWEYTSSPPRRDGGVPVLEFASERADIRELLPSLKDEAVRSVADPLREQFRLEYDPEAGVVRLTRAMRTRRDIPDTVAFDRQLAYLIQLGDENRAAQQCVPEGECP